jgi:hypothetical protein
MRTLNWLKQTTAIQDQATVMRKQMDIMEKQVRLQDAAMTQWISMQNWQVEMVEHSGPLSNIPKTLRKRLPVDGERSA